MFCPSEEPRVTQGERRLRSNNGAGEVVVMEFAHTECEMASRELQGALPGSGHTFQSWSTKPQLLAQ